MTSSKLWSRGARSASRRLPSRPARTPQVATLGRLGVADLGAAPRAADRQLQDHVWHRRLRAAELELLVRAEAAVDRAVSDHSRNAALRSAVDGRPA